MNFFLLPIYLFFLSLQSNGYAHTRAFDKINLSAAKYMIKSRSRQMQTTSQEFPLLNLGIRSTPITQSNATKHQIPCIYRIYHDDRILNGIKKMNDIKKNDDSLPRVYSNNVNSINYYNNNAQIFYERTINSGMSSNYEKFTPLLKPSAKILDAGCGVGRDTRFFESLGYKVTAFDGSEEMIKLANQIISEPAKLMLFKDMKFCEEFDGVWAAASLIHVPNEELEEAILSIHKALKPDGVFFATFKHGEGQHTQEGRTFYYMKEQVIKEHLSNFFEVIDIWKTKDSTANVAHSPDKMWLNVLAKKS